MVNLDEHFIAKMNEGKRRAIKEVKIAALIDLSLILYCFCWACYDGGWTLFWSLVTLILLFSTTIIWSRQNFYIGFNEQKYRKAKSLTTQLLEQKEKIKKEKGE